MVFKKSLRSRPSSARKLSSDNEETAKENRQVGQEDETDEDDEEYVPLPAADKQNNSRRRHSSYSPEIPKTSRTTRLSGSATALEENNTVLNSRRSRPDDFKCVTNEINDQGKKSDDMASEVEDSDSDPDYAIKKSKEEGSDMDIDRDEAEDADDSSPTSDDDREEEGVGVRRSLRARTIKNGSYSEVSFILGGGGAAKGYRRTRINRNRESIDSEADIRSVHSSRRSTRRLIENREENSESNVEETNVTGIKKESLSQDDMYSRVKRTRRSSNAATIIRPKSVTRKLTQDEEPVSRRLRKRDTLPRSMTLNSEPFEHNIRRNSRQKKRRRSQNSDSSSSTDSDDFIKVQSPSKKIQRKLLGGSQNSINQTISKKEMKMLMEVQPIAVDSSITFKSVGGLNSFIDKLKEIVLFPLLYHEFYEQRGMSAPKGILLHGPPGTGKTLLARALSNECSSINGRKVTFFLRKGADLLNKFVGESERQLRMLFQQAALNQPSIIFFDEIDGLAPVRSAKSDQIHNSIVSSLLAEIDGLQDRGQIIIMGSTNRLDFVDPALRRPGRFDCELPIFLPTRDGRKEILNVHITKWKDHLPNELLDELADRTIAFNGADLKYLCWNASMNSLRRTYPQIYGSSNKYLLNYDSIKVEREDWEEALKSITPSTQRSLFSTYSPAQPLPAFIKPLLTRNLNAVSEYIQSIFPHDSASLVIEPSVKRVLIRGDVESGLNTYIIPALLHTMESVPVHVLSYEALHMEGNLVEFSVTQKCMEVMKQCKPSICFIPDFDGLCDLLNESAKEIIIRMMSQSLQKPVLFLATVEGNDESTCDLSGMFKGRELKLQAPSVSAIHNFFKPIFQQAAQVKVEEKTHLQLEELPLAPPEAIIKPKINEEELRSIEKQESAIFRELRIFLRQILTKLAGKKKFEEFTRPVDTTEVPDYLSVVTHPMDFETMMRKINGSGYFCAKEFLDDIYLITSNCLNYNPDKTDSDKRLRMQACELKDFAEKLIDDEMDSDFEQECHKIIKNRKERKLDQDETIICDNNSNNSDVVVITPNCQFPSVSNPRSDPGPKSSGLKLGGRPSSAVIKRRKISSWSRGSIKKPKRPGCSRNLETDRFSQLSESQQSQEMEEDGKGTTLSQSSSCLNPNSKSPVSVVPTCVSISREIHSLEDEISSNQIIEPNKDAFHTLLTQTERVCAIFSIVKLIDFRFQLLQLVTKHEYSKEKGELRREIKDLLSDSTHSTHGSRSVFTVKVPASSAPVLSTLRFNGLEKKISRQKSNHTD